MRVIKFRAWDKTARIFYFVSLSDNGWSHQDTDLEGHELSEWQQYTGLKDRHGVEIYEGDVVAFKTFYFGNERDNKKVVEWSQWSSDDFGQPDNAGYFNIGSHMEVIGNIYESPELLKEEKS